MRMKTKVLFSLLALSLVGIPAALAEEKHSEAMEKGHKAEGNEHKTEGEHADKMSCTAPVHLTQSAEIKMGGAHYKGPMPKSAMAMGKMKMGVMQSENVLKSEQAMPGMKGMVKDAEMPEMKGAHNVHKGFRGGEFIMVPNQLHHMEAVYSLKCGFQLFMYNAFSEPISVNRFQALILILPEGGDKFFEVMRFLVPSKDSSVLQSQIKHHHDDPNNPKGLFEVELYVNFPEDIQPRKFDLVVGTEAN